MGDVATKPDPVVLPIDTTSISVTNKNTIDSMASASPLPPESGRPMTNDVLVSLLEEAVAQAVAKLREDRPLTWIDRFRLGLILATADAAKIAGVVQQTIRGWCEDTENTDHPMGYQSGRYWLVDAEELLYQVEKREDLHARRKAHTRLKAHQETLARTPPSLKVPVGEVE